MSVFQRLNRESKITIMLVTHEPDVAQFASRIVMMRDGRILHDQAVARRRDAELELAAMPPVEEQVEVDAL
jgi:putative ABC transport system ATP-binding protein